MPLEFHARYDALGKAYTYVLNLGAPSPFADRYSWVPYHRMDVDKIRAAAQVLVGTHDYSSFVVERSMIDEAGPHDLPDRRRNDRAVLLLHLRRQRFSLQDDPLSDGDA